MFGKGTWEVIKGELVMAKGIKVGTLYTLRANKEILNVVDVAKEGNSMDL